ncbi:MAG: thiamine pyrophosphate-dependent dehydrogenase E1 component subunit alpha [Candidatus Scalindua sp.]|nr:thiamine pyrophosphate-dependent dehydrogenase E1 component subunit alpha [Candidatus Scalindua sp.]
MDIEVLKSLLYTMKRIRFVEEAISTRYSEGKMRCPTHLCTGQEAVAAGVCANLRADDYVVSTHRAHGHYLAKGGSLNNMLAEIYGKATGCSSGKGGSMHIVDESVGFMGSTSIVGGTIPIGTGLGFSIMLNKTDQLSCVFLGDGATEEGVFYESLNFAILKKLPVIYICENNLYSVYSPLGVRQPAERSISKMVQSLGMASESSDGNEVVDVYIKARSAVEYIRKGRGPFFLEFATYRWREHCGPNFDNDIGYRTEAEFVSWKEKDPIALVENKIKDRCLMDHEEIQGMDSLIESEVNNAFGFAEGSPYPLQEEAFVDLFKE